MVPTIPYELHPGILEHIPPSPQTIAHASVVCKAWCRIVYAPGFLHRCHARHVVPVVMGFFHNSNTLPRPFVQINDTTSLSFRFPNDGNYSWTFMDCRHGRVLLRNGRWFLVWHPMTGHYRLINAESSRWEEYTEKNSNAALLCVVDDNDGHQVCCQQPTSPFRVALVHNDSQGRVHAGVYSSLTGQWSLPPTPVDLPLLCDIRVEPCVIIFNTMYQPLNDYHVLAYDMDKSTLTVFERPNGGNARLMKVDGGGRLGLASMEDLTLRMWARGAYSGWVLRTSVDLGEAIACLSKVTLPKVDSSFLVMPRVKIIGSTEEGDALFLWTMVGIFILCPKTMEFKKVHEAVKDMEIVYPYTAFPTAASW
ncbi:uncharacterized protein LOC119298115 [Triticum dicoccoides]|uniref:uncharacterized protein LOC119298115 n=1 Tax=Triticum dicoccoides TaxID=85692 RepID=UPI000E7BCA60|nr:uncharacterized protein LOC119298115 [Triticum dicoccoides]